MQKVAQQVDRALGRVGGSGREFYSANQIEAGFFGVSNRLVIAGKRIMIGNRESFELQRHGVIDQFRRSITSIRRVGVRMQIDHSSIFLNRSAFAITETELSVIAALAIIGLKRIPKNG